MTCQAPALCTRHGDRSHCTWSAFCLKGGIYGTRSSQPDSYLFTLHFSMRSYSFMQLRHDNAVSRAPWADEVVQPLPLPGPYEVACSIVAQDSLEQAPAGREELLGRPASERRGRYVTDRWLTRIIR